MAGKAGGGRRRMRSATIKSHVKMSVSGIICRTTEYRYKEDFVFRIKNNNSCIVNSNTKLFRILAIFNGLKGDAF